MLDGAGRRTRTPDLLITNQLLYRLSYTGISNSNTLIIASAFRFVKTFFAFFEKFFDVFSRHAAG